MFQAKTHKFLSFFDIILWKQDIFFTSLENPSWFRNIVIFLAKKKVGKVFFAVQSFCDITVKSHIKIIRQI